MEEVFARKLCDRFLDEFYERKNYLLSIEVAKQTFFKLKENTIANKSINNFFLWCCLINIARCYEKMKLYKKAINYCILSLRYAGDEKIVIETYWTLAQCYAEFNKIAEAEFYFNKIIKYYEEQKMYVFLAQILNTKAWYLKDSDSCLRAIKIYERFYIDDKTNFDNISKAYDTLCNICQNNKDNNFILITYKNLNYKSKELNNKIRIKLTKYLVS